MTGATKETETNTTQPFQPGVASTPYHGGEQIEMHTVSQEQSGLPETSFDEDIPLLENFIHKNDKPRMLEEAREFIRRLFPKMDFKKMDPIGFSKKSGNETKIVSFGEKGGESEIFKGRRGVLKSFTDNFKDALGPKAAKIIDKDNASIREVRQRLREAQKQLNEMETNAVQLQRTKDDLQHVRNRIEQTRARIDGQNKDQILKVKANCKD